MSDVCYYIEIDGEWVRIRGDRRHATEASNTAFADIIRAARRLNPERLAAAHPTNRPLDERIRDMQSGKEL